MCKGQCKRVPTSRNCFWKQSLWRVSVFKEPWARLRVYKVVSFGFGGNCVAWVLPLPQCLRLRQSSMCWLERWLLSNTWRRWKRWGSRGISWSSKHDHVFRRCSALLTFKNQQGIVVHPNFLIHSLILCTVIFVCRTLQWTCVQIVCPMSHEGSMWWHFKSWASVFLMLLNQFDRNYVGLLLEAERTVLCKHQGSQTKVNSTKRDALLPSSAHMPCLLSVSACFSSAMRFFVLGVEVNNPDFHGYFWDLLSLVFELSRAFSLVIMHVATIQFHLILERFPCASPSQLSDPADKANHTDSQKKRCFPSERPCHGIEMEWPFAIFSD